MPTTITTSKSWLSRLGDSVKNVLLGCVFVLAAVVLLFWNEGKAVKTHQSLKEGASVVISVSSDVRDPQNNEKLIHFSGMAKTPSVLIDTEFGVGGSSLKLRRIVEVYQWVEHADTKTVNKLGGGTETTTTYTYSKDWSDDLVSSTAFQESQTHQNPSTKLFENKEFMAESVSVGAYEIPQSLLGSLSGYQSFVITPQMLATLPQAKQEKLKLLENTIYYGVIDPATPEVGNLRIRYESIAVQNISVITKQSADSLMPYITKNGREIAMIQAGVHSASEMFVQAVEGNTLMTWAFRLLGVVCMFIGFRMTLGVFPVIVSVIPLLGSIAGAGSSLIAVAFAMSMSMLIIAIAWLAYRPLVSVGLIVAAVIFVVSVSKLRRSAGKK